MSKRRSKREFAVRGGLMGQVFPWGNEFKENGAWRGSFLCTDRYCSRSMVGTRAKGQSE
jgi:hypothetical protein